MYLHPDAVGSGTYFLPGSESVSGIIYFGFKSDKNEKKKNLKKLGFVFRFNCTEISKDCSFKTESDISWLILLFNLL